MDERVNELRSLLPQCRLADWNRIGSRLVQALRSRDGSPSVAQLEDWIREARASSDACIRRRQRVPVPTYPADLPICSRREEIVGALRRHQVVVIAGETGSGKTTQIPKMCLEAGLGIEGMIGCTQPRRVAAVSISQRLAEELQVGWGREVGCKIRFDDRTGPDTFIKLMTDGILLAETQGDPLLSEYNAIIIDEAHERSLNIDFLLGYLKGLLGRRSDLKLVITSATIDTATFSKAFNDAPVIEVSGRVYPVEVRYLPPDDVDPEDGTGNYVETAARATELVVEDSSQGDVLVFMPSERDIRDTVDLVSGRLGNQVEVVPLYGRLSNADQQRVFSATSRRKVIVATNLAETSLTLPGIRFVIDTGLARMSRYDSRTRTKRLPIEPIAQSSANQRKGRAGRVQAGVCIRLYSEEDFSGRPPFTQPEIQRANLAEVILRMKAYQLGDIEAFPFVHPPPPTAIRSGYALLVELGALDAEKKLTPLGSELARLPVDPVLGRMLLQSRREGAVCELLVLAAGLSLVDPRERPSENAEAADAAHRRYEDPRSDFISLLNLWTVIESEWQTLKTTGQQRRFCRDRFLSHLRIREWQDLHEQLSDTLSAIAPVSSESPPANYDAIHRSITSGLLGNLALRIGRNLYRGSGNREVIVFPGSALFVRTEKSRPKDGHPKPEEPGPARGASTGAGVGQPEWIVAGEMIQTSQLFARMVAGIDPRWVVDLAPHLCQRVHQNPGWEAAAGTVLGEERWMLHGLEIHRAPVVWSRIDPEGAAKIFIRAALVEEGLLPGEARNGEEAVKTRRPTGSPNLSPHALTFLEANRQVRNRVETWRTRVRQAGLVELDETLYRFYRRQLPVLSSVSELNRWLQDAENRARMMVTEGELSGRSASSYDPASFPEKVKVGAVELSAAYAYAPGEEVDGVTLRMTVAQAAEVSSAAAAWAIPGWRSALIDEMLRSLPKSIRRSLMPLPAKVQEIVRDFHPKGRSIEEDLGQFLQQKYGVPVPAGSWNLEGIPGHLRPRVEIIGPGLQPLLSGRDLTKIKQKLPEVLVLSTRESGDWERTTGKWERFAITEWNLDDLPERIPVGDPALGQFAWPGLAVEAGLVHLRLFTSQRAAARASSSGVPELMANALAKELAWLDRELRSLARCAPLYAPIGPLDELQSTALQHLRDYVLSLPTGFRLTRADFLAAIESGKQRLRGLVPPWVDQVTAILELRQQIAQRLGVASSAPKLDQPRMVRSFDQLTVVASRPGSAAANPWSMELDRLVPPRFLERVPYTRLSHLPRFLKALQIRGERAAIQPEKEQARRQLLAPYVDACNRWKTVASNHDELLPLWDEFRWMLEEYRVSIFAQELGTSIPVSSKRLDQHLVRMEACLAPSDRTSSTRRT